MLGYSENISIFASPSQTSAISTYDIHETHFQVYSLAELGEALYSAHSGVSVLKLTIFGRLLWQARVVTCSLLKHLQLGVRLVSEPDPV